MTADEIRGALHAILFVAGEPVSIDQLVDALGGEAKDAIAAELEGLRASYERDGSGIALEQTAGGFRFATRPAFDPFLRKFFSRQSEARLSMAGLETLAIVAYRQPVTAPEINEIRGVNSAGVLRTLLDRRMVRIAGRKPVVGSPFLYRTTKEFLVHFGLNSIQDLPRLEEFSEMLGVNLPEEMVLPYEIPLEGEGAPMDEESASSDAPPERDRHADDVSGEDQAEQRVEAGPRSQSDDLNASAAVSEQADGELSESGDDDAIAERTVDHGDLSAPGDDGGGQAEADSDTGEEERKPVESFSNDQD